MKDFDLKAAKAGAPICMRSGAEVRIICFDRVHSEYPIVGLLRNSKNEEYTGSFTIDGHKFLTSDSDGDLMMRDDDYADKLARGEYGNHIDEATEKVDPTFKENLTVDREYWRRVYAGQAMMGIFAGRSWPKDGAPDCINYARNAIELAEALIEELEKQRNDE